jgi:hypothetical protein
MSTVEAQERLSTEFSPDAIREQLELVVRDSAFRSSKRSVEFLRYVVSKTLDGAADQIKERTIGVEVFGRDPTYDTNIDHVVRTAAIELRKRLSIYYGQEWHRSELRINLVPGSYIPRFTSSERSETVGPDRDALPFGQEHAVSDSRALLAEERRSASPVQPPHLWLKLAVLAAVIGLIGAGYLWSHRPTAQDLFWKPLLDMPGPVLIAAGDVPDGPPSPGDPTAGSGELMPVLHRSSDTNIPFSDAMTMARVLGTLQARGKTVILRQDAVSSFSELRQSPVVLIGAFNNQWTLRLTHRLRYSLALDPERHLIYIKDGRNPTNRVWSWATDQPKDHQGAAGRPPLQDFALISRIWNSDTGNPVVVIGGLYRYGTESAGEFLNDPRLMQTIGREVALQNPRSNIQIVLGTTVTDGTAGPPRVLAVSSE